MKSNLRVGAQVMLRINYDVDQGLVNGTRGIVVGFEKPSRGIASDPSLFHNGEFRLTSGACESEKCRVLKRVLYPDDVKLPLVCFERGVKSNLTMLMPYYRWEESVADDGNVYVWGIPMSLAWAITIHKSQGATLDQAYVDLEGAFLAGQAYVALSRVRTLEGLSIKSWARTRVKVEPKVITYMDKVRKANGMVTVEEEEVDEDEYESAFADLLEMSQAVPASKVGSKRKREET